MAGVINNLCCGKWAGHEEPELERLRTKVANQQENIAGLERQLAMRKPDPQTRRADALESKMWEARNALAEVTAERDRAREIWRAANNHIAALEEENDNLRDDHDCVFKWMCAGLEISERNLIEERDQLRARVEELVTEGNARLDNERQANQAMTHRWQKAEARIAALEVQLREANHRCGAAWRDLADAKKRIADLDAHVLLQRGMLREFDPKEPQP